MYSTKYMTNTIEKIVNELLVYLKRSLENLAIESTGSLEISTRLEMISFLESQFDIRLENLLAVKNISIHHLESGIKANIIQQKQKIVNDILDNILDN